MSDPVNAKLRKCNDGGMTPAGPCVKRLNNKKHFIIHTPERDKVISDNGNYLMMSHADNLWNKLYYTMS